MNKISRYALHIFIFFAATAQAKILEFIEDSTAYAAPENIVELTKPAALLAYFKDDYEVAIPKKAGMQMNPWTRFITCGINSYTKNPVLIINPAWFLELPADQQEFWLVRSFILLEKGTTPLAVKAIPFIMLVVTLILLILIFWLLGKTVLRSRPIWLRVLITWGIMVGLNFAILTPINNKIIQYANVRHDWTANKIAVQKTGKRDVGIAAYESLDALIKNELKNGDVFWKPHENVFQDLACHLKGLMAGY